jgi:MSHA biogenesis protein MshJ
MKDIAITKRLSLVYERYQGFNFRERVLIALAVLSLTWMIWEATLGGFLAESQESISRQVNVMYDKLQAAVQEQSALQTALTRDPNQRLAAERDRLDSELRSLNASIGSVLDRFVAPDRMPSLLEDVLRHHQGLKLKRMVSLPVEPVQLTDPEADTEEQAASPLIFRHPLRMEFEGNYFEVLAYLNELEEGPWEFGWRQLNYKVSEYPLAEVTIEIETLSREKSWIGV